MSSITKQFPTESDGPDSDGVRTYRGRTLVELIPQIRADLGPDAVIVREREGLIGGVNGFFAKRFVEVQAHAGRSVDILDDQQDAVPEVTPESITDKKKRTGVRRSYFTGVGSGAFDVATSGPDELAEAPVAAPEPIVVPVAPPEPIVTPIAPPLPIDAPAPPEPEPLVASMRSELTFAERLAAAAEVEVDGWADAEPIAWPTAEPWPRMIALPVPSAEPEAIGEPEATAEPEAADVEPEPDATVAEPEATAEEPTTEPEATAEPETTTADAGTAQGPRLSHEAQPGPPPEPIDPALAAALELPAQPAAETNPSLEVPGPRPRPRRLVRRRRQVGTVKLETLNSAAITAELAAHGMTAGSARQLVLKAAAHRLPLTPGMDLREAVRTTLARHIPRAAELPTDGAAIAFVGAGGSGKTRCAAALAAAYSRGSTLKATALTIDHADPGRTIATLLKPEGVRVHHRKRNWFASRTVSKNRWGGFVVIDTPSITVSNGAAVQSMASDLSGLELDAVIVALPATLGAAAAQQLLSALEPLQPTGIAVTHADETDQLGVAVELSCATGIPIAFVHDGLDLHTALTLAEPSTLAARLLP